MNLVCPLCAGLLNEVMPYNKNPYNKNYLAEAKTFECFGCTRKFKESMFFIDFNSSNSNEYYYTLITLNKKLYISGNANTKLTTINSYKTTDRFDQVELDLITPDQLHKYLDKFETMVFYT